MSRCESPIIVALDFPDIRQAMNLADRLNPSHCRLKVGNELFTRGGPALVEQLVTRKFDVFLDLKFHDIPNTVARACAAAADLGVWMMNVHVPGGRRMMEAACGVLSNINPPRPLLVGVTLLTSLEDTDLAEIGGPGKVEDHVVHLAQLAHKSGLDGVVCSPWEVGLVSAACGANFLKVTPGIRPAWAAQGDQKRVMTPAQALRAGVDYLVIGRPITEAPDPLAALAHIEQELHNGKT